MNDCSALGQAYKPETTKITPVKMRIIFSDDYPVYKGLRRLVPREKLAVDDQIKKWLREEIIRLSFSDYASPVVITPKKDGLM